MQFHLSYDVQADISNITSANSDRIKLWIVSNLMTCNCTDFSNPVATTLIFTGPDSDNSRIKIFANVDSMSEVILSVLSVVEDRFIERYNEFNTNFMERPNENMSSRFRDELLPLLDNVDGENNYLDLPSK